MRISLPYSRRKRYLTGIDWMVGTLDDVSRRECGLGHTSQIVLEIEGLLPVERLRSSLAEFLGRFPTVRGAPARDLNLAPYWRRSSGNERGELPFHEVHLPGDADTPLLIQTLAAGVNQTLCFATTHLSFLWITVGDRRGYLAMAFDHWLFDARGAEMFVSLFLEHLDGRPLDSRLSALPSTEPAHLNQWMQKFLAGQRVNRHLLWLREGRTATLPRPRVFQRPDARFVLIRYDRDQTQRILDTAYREAGYLMLHSFLLAATLQALHPLFQKRNPDATDYVVPASLDMRPPDRAEALLFFNHLSFLLFRIPVSLVSDRRALAVHVRDQVYQQVKSGLPQDITEAAHLMRIAPLRLLGWIARIPLRGELASFGFARLAPSSLHQPATWPGRVVNLFHMPRMPVPPGIGVVANQFEGCLNLVLSAQEEVASAEEMESIADALRHMPLAS